MPLNPLTENSAIEPMTLPEMQAIVMAMAQVFVEIEGDWAAQKLGVYAEQFLDLLTTVAEDDSDYDPNQIELFQ